MSEDTEKYQLWGTFSTMDHLREGAFLAEVMLYDKLVIPIPPDPEKADTLEDREFAINEQKRWIERDWMPERQRKLLDILGDIAFPIEWNRVRHQSWVAEYEKSKSLANQRLAAVLAGWSTGEVLLNDIPAMAGGRVAVSPYNSLEELEEDLGITKIATAAERLEQGRELPGSLCSVIVGREILLPHNPNRDEFYLLKQAVDLVRETDYRQVRSSFDAAQQKFIRDGKTDVLSLTMAVKSMREQIEEMENITRQKGDMTTLGHVFSFGQAVIDLLIAQNPIAAIGKIAISLGKYTTTNRLANPANPNEKRPYAALLVDAKRHLQLALEA